VSSPAFHLRTSPFVKICCITSRQEARFAIEAGADAIGLVSRMPSGPGVIDNALIADIAAHIAQDLNNDAARRGQKPVQTFLLTAQQTAAAIAAQHAVSNTTTLQLVDDVAPQELLALRRLLPEVALVQVIHVTGEDALQRALALAPLVDMLLLDSGNPQLPVKQLGGTGRIHDWSVSLRIAARSPVPVLLAGGLNADNARQALGAVHPYGLDVCSGVRSEGLLDRAKLADFMRAVKCAA
jgi:phosphoribosylanthranilate isomerase